MATQEVFNWSGVDGVRFVPQTSASSNGKQLQCALSQMVINGVTASVPEPASNVASWFGTWIGHYSPAAVASE